MSTQRSRAPHSGRGAKRPKVACVACRASIPEGAIVCEVCGAPQGELDPCPHCRGKGSIGHDDELHLVCKLCGGPRVPYLPEGTETGGGEVKSLVKAEAARKNRGLWRFAGILGALGLPFVVLFALLVWLISSFTAAAVTALLFGGPFAAMLAYARSKDKAKTKEITQALDQAWLSVAADLVEERDGRMRVKDLADALSIDLARAEQLMAMLSVHDVLRTGPRVTVPPDERFDALEDEQEEAEAEQEALAEREARAEREALAEADAPKPARQKNPKRRAVDSPRAAARDVEDES